MLARVLCNTHGVSPALCNRSIRTFFDYIGEMERKQANKEKVEEIEEKFTWDWTNWWTRVVPESTKEIKRLQSEYTQFETYSASSPVSRKSEKIDFEFYRNNIADPSFVDELEIELEAQAACLKSITDMDTLEKWSKANIDSFNREGKEFNEKFMKPENVSSRSVENGLEFNKMVAELTEEIQKDYEQFDAEKNIFSFESKLMKLANNPQMAEISEEARNEAQAYDSHLLGQRFNVEYIKYQRQEQIQDETERKKWLETYERTSKLIGYELHGFRVSEPHGH